MEIDRELYKTVKQKFTLFLTEVSRITKSQGGTGVNAGILCVEKKIKKLDEYFDFEAPAVETVKEVLNGDANKLSKEAFEALCSAYQASQGVEKKKRVDFAKKLKISLQAEQFRLTGVLEIEAPDEKHAGGDDGADKLGE